MRQDQTVERHVKVTDMPVAAGETIVYEAGGGGGFGDPLTRDPDLVVADVRDGYVSAHSAERDYGVVISEGLNGPEVDEEATTALRGGSPRATDPELRNT